MSAIVPEIRTLERLIEQKINLGLKDPHECYPALEHELGPELLELARPYLAEFVSTMARQKLNALRRSDIAKITPQSIADPEVKLRSLWIPNNEQGISYKRIADMTADDFDARAAYLERMLIGLSRHIGWCRNVAQELRRANLATAGQLDALPPLPEIDDVSAS